VPVRGRYTPARKAARTSAGNGTARRVALSMWTPKAGVAALDHWIDIVAPVFMAKGTSAKDARAKAQLLIATMEGALLIARIRQSPAPINDIAASFR
jgi:hypothetical protein